MSNPTKTSQAGIDLIKSFESCRLAGYADLKGIPTIGWGHTGPDVWIGKKISQEEADKLLVKDLAHFEEVVVRDIKVPVTQHVFDALTCLCYNIGSGNLGKSTLLKDLNSYDYTKASKDFLDWDEANGHVVAGLLRRRQAESQLFNE